MIFCTQGGGNEQNAGAPHGQTGGTPLERRRDRLIIRRIVGCQVVRALIGDDVVDRRSDEAEDDFAERAKVEALARTDCRPCRVLLLSGQAL